MADREKPKYLLKIIVIGPSGAGKSSLLMRYALDSFEEETRATIGVDFKHKTLVVEGDLVNCQIWDTAGQERFSCISKEYYRGANGALLVYDVTDHESFDRINHWYQELLAYCQTDTPPITILVGNKSDMKHLAQVSTDEAKRYAKDKQLGFYETSAKMNSNVDEAFGSLVEDIVKDIKSKQMSNVENDDTSVLPPSTPIVLKPKEETSQPPVGVKQDDDCSC
eukprot:TRINITY_DN4372_c0_g1_i9.p1 TRINITY_DN4372_c0_g1~~TRINITY_DN4372_c0_g1_i9.p1  ORF type:complete len:223 (+),score=47.14 TRINITY_DN4372_c0_g1_i9:370-1038(+)